MAFDPAALGHAIGSPLVTALMRELGTKRPRSTTANQDHAGNVYGLRAGQLTFDGYTRYVPQFGEPLSRVTHDANELILTEVDFETKRLPLGLVVGDSKDTVVAKLGKKPSTKEKAGYGDAWWFHFAEYRMLGAFSPKGLVFVRFMKLDRAIKDRAALKSRLRTQVIVPANAKAVRALAKQLPTARWTKRMAAGDTAFTKAGIAAVAKLLVDYVEVVAVSTEATKAAAIHASVKKVVVALNKENRDAMIETVEREELCDFIDRVVRASGFDPGPGVDLTEPWRAW